MKLIDEIKLTLKVFKRGELDIEEASRNILYFYDNSERFNSPNFFGGFMMGILISLIALAFIL